MSPEAQRIAIAVAVGTAGPMACNRVGGCFYEMGMKGPGKCDRDRLAQLPDYPNDLNAMHEAEKVLTRDQADDFRDWLELFDRPPTNRCAAQGRAWHATAAQRAEAFLKTLNLWRDET